MATDKGERGKIKLGMEESEGGGCRYGVGEGCIYIGVGGGWDDVVGVGVSEVVLSLDLERCMHGTAAGPMFA